MSPKLMLMAQGLLSRINLRFPVVPNSVILLSGMACSKVLNLIMFNTVPIFILPRCALLICGFCRFCSRSLSFFSRRFESQLLNGVSDVLFVIELSHYR